MKKVLISLIFLSGCASAPKDNDVCKHLDDASGFARCETQEVVCYESKAGQACWPKLPAPKEADKPVEKKKKS